VHHKNVGSKEDPITSEKNYNYYSYTIRAFVSAYVFNFKYSKKIFFLCILGNLSYLLGIFFITFKSTEDYNYSFGLTAFYLLNGIAGFMFLEAV
jgi:hypothetical protein